MNEVPSSVLMQAPSNRRGIPAHSLQIFLSFKICCSPSVRIQRRSSRAHQDHRNLWTNYIRCGRIWRGSGNGPPLASFSLLPPLSCSSLSLHPTGNERGFSLTAISGSSSNPHTFEMDVWQRLHDDLTADHIYSYRGVCAVILTTWVSLDMYLTYLEAHLCLFWVTQAP